MDSNINNIPNIDNYIAKYMDENGCSFQEACNELDIDEKTLNNYQDKDLQ